MGIPRWSNQQIKTSMILQLIVLKTCGSQSFMPHGVVILDGVAKVGALDMTTDREAGSSFGIRGFPSLKFFGINKTRPKDYNGRRDLESLVKFAKEQIENKDSQPEADDIKPPKRKMEDIIDPIQRRKLQEDRIIDPEQQKVKDQVPKFRGAGDKERFTPGRFRLPPDILTFNETTFDTQVIQNNDVWFILFYKADDQESFKIAQIMRRDQIRVRDQAKIAIINVEENPELVARFKIENSPVLIYFNTNDTEGYQRSDADARELSLKDLQSIAPTLQKLLREQNSYLEEIQDSRQFYSKCKPRGSCVFFFVPKISTQITEKVRKTQLDQLRDSIKAIEGEEINFFWSQYEDQQALQDTFKISTSESEIKVALIKAFQRKFATLDEEFSKESLIQFISDTDKPNYNFQEFNMRPNIVDKNRDQDFERLRRNNRKTKDSKQAKDDL
ncbi:protein disulfide isomerase [Stylonychia lemnae]|uniref:Protein disulfide isomerase n=1 Tax=Stylonychia lemnae TaxID=5949 RepID=A0A078A057_STYLE|nr:protein disulfide isomerase [Stylonychia lemnae]|eukprot:CDW74163.1 protein disulfide isomerase [Stylonychia lemnae]